MKRIFLYLFVNAFFISNAIADNFVWQYYDDTFYYSGITDPTNGDLSSVHDISYIYTFDTKSILMNQSEDYYIDNGTDELLLVTGGASFNFDDIYLNDPDLGTILFLGDTLDDFLASYREQATADVNALIDTIINQTHANNVDKRELNSVVTMTVDDIFAGADITSTDIYNRLQQKIYTLSKRNKNISAVALALKNIQPISNSKLAAIKQQLDYSLYNNLSEYSRLLNNLKPNTRDFALDTARNVLSVINNQITGHIDGIRGRSGGDEPSNIDIWAQGLTNYSKKTGNSEFNSNTFGITTGIDKSFGNQIIAGLGYSHNNTKANSGDRRTDVTGNTIFAYGEYRPFNQWYINALLSSGIFTYTEDTSVVQSDYRTYNFGANVTTGYDLNNGLGLLTGVRYFNVNQSSYTDSIGQRITSDNSSVLTLVAGTKYNTKLSHYFIPNAHINVIYDVLQSDNKTNIDILGSTYQIKSQNLTPWGIESGLAIDIFDDNWNFELGYDLELRNNFISHTGRIKVKYSF